ncbi:MAG: hypothetical protein HY899_19855 [Deltaproteobacteria bacterium]|nr:hypothetical protein [Deltaproteobacteria bacterium]
MNPDAASHDRRRCPSHLAPLVAALAVLAAGHALAPATALASSFGGWGDTGWSHYDKRECCEDAVWLAQDDAAARCEASGGVPRIRSGTTRGLCDWDARGGGSDRVYRCTAKTDVYCR